MNFADVNSPYECGPTLNEAMNNLEITTENFFEWFSFKNVKANVEALSNVECRLLIFPYQPI